MHFDKRKAVFTMIKIHIGLKGSGKTKRIIDDVNNAITVEKGNVVCITEGNRLMHDIDRAARMVNTEQFDIKNFDMFEGLLCGIIAQDFDVTHIFIDSVFKSVPAESMAKDLYSRGYLRLRRSRRLRAGHQRGGTAL